MMRALLFLLPLLLSSCATIEASGRVFWCFLCASAEVKAKKNGPEQPGRSNTKSTQDFSDPEKDQAPQDDAKK